MVRVIISSSEYMLDGEEGEGEEACEDIFFISVYGVKNLVYAMRL
jgi:hypothetical protein